MTSNLRKTPPAAIRPGPHGRAVELFDPVRQSVFLQALAEKPIVGLACRKAGISTKTAYRLKERSPAFAEAWGEAISESVDDLEAHALERARESDTVLLRMLESHRPELYSRKLDIKQSVAVDFCVDLVPMAAGDSEVLEGELLPAEDREPGE